VKRTERILGIVAVSLFVAGTLFKFGHLTGSAAMHLVSVLIFNFVYLPLQLIRQRREVHTLLERSYLVFRFITLFMALLAFIFKIQHWPGAAGMLFLGSWLIPLYIVFYFYMRIKGKGKIPFQWSDLFIAVLAYVIYLFVTKSLVSPSVVQGYVVLEEQYTRLNAGLQNANQMIYASYDSVEFQGNGELIESVHHLREITAEILTMIDTLRSGFIASIYNDPLGGDFDLATANQFLLASTMEPRVYFLENSRGDELKAGLAEYMKEIQEIQNRYNLPTSLINSGFDLGDSNTRWGETLSWQRYLFENVPVASVFTTLSWIQQVILLTERGTQNQLSTMLSSSETQRALEQLVTDESKLAMELKENEILRISQQKELQRIQLEKSQSELNQRNTMTGLAMAGIVFVLILFSISTRAYFLKQKANRKLALQKEEISAKNTELSQYNEEILAQRDEIEAQRDEIEAQRNLVFEQKEQIEQRIIEIKASFDYAMRLQDAMLPGPALLEQHFSDHFIFFRPKQMVSGDFYWWTESGDSLVIAVSDCTGHGVPGAFMSLLGASLLKEIVNREGNTAPGRILDRMREEVINALDQRGAAGEQKDGMDMAVISLDPRTLRCRYAGANNPLYLLRRSKLTIYRPNMMPVSYYEEMVPFESVEIQLEANDQLYLFSDGYADQFGGEKRKKFKYSRFRQVLTENGDLSMPRQQQLLSDVIREWQGKYEQTDDMVIVGIKI